jgi:hypothetical protein
LIPVGGQQYTLGWEDAKKDGPCFVVVRLGLITDKVLDRFPLTEDGWARAWVTLVGLDAGAARAVAEEVQKLNAGGAVQVAEHERQAQVYEAFLNGGPVTAFRALGVQVLTGAGSVYTIGSHDAVAKTNSSRVLGSLAGAQAVVTDGSQAWSPGRAMFLPIALTGLATKTRQGQHRMLPPLPQPGAAKRGSVDPWLAGQLVLGLLPRHAALARSGHPNLGPSRPRL